MAITFSKFGNNGRTGNILFQYAAMLGFGAKYNQRIILPKWEDSKYFDFKFPDNGEVSAMKYNEPKFHYTPDYYDEIFNYNDLDKLMDYDIEGYFQSEKYWEHCKDLVKDALTFKDDFIHHVLDQAPDNAFNRKTIAISVRRGDYVDNPNYETLPITYYILALQENFPDWRDYNLMIFSDDIPYCKVHFDCLDNVYFSENNSAIEDLCLLTQCDHFIIANSTFSWWGAYLGEREGTKIVRPEHHFAGRLKETCDLKDYYPERWIKFNHKKEDRSNKKIDLKDVTFTIPIAYDHHDREQNLGLSICLLQHSFNTNIILMEQSSTRFHTYKPHIQKYIRANGMEKFHRTKMLNEMAKQCETPIIVNWDCDVVIPPLQILETVRKIKEGVDMCFPYDGRFARMPRLLWFRKLEKYLDIGIIGDTKLNGMNNGDDLNSVGGAVFFNKESFIFGGMENENFVSFAPEDVERNIRFRKLGFKVERVKGCLYHINHWIGTNSSKNNPDYEANKVECEKVKNMTKEELINYINTWTWIQ